MLVFVRASCKSPSPFKRISWYNDSDVILQFHRMKEFFSIASSGQRVLTPG